MDVKRVLLVTKNQADTNLLSDLLKTSNCLLYSIDTVSSYEDAIALMRRHYYDVYLFQTELSDSDGLSLYYDSLALRIHDDAYQLVLPVIFILEADSSAEQLNPYFHAGASHCLFKQHLSHAQLCYCLEQAMSHYQTQLQLRKQRHQLTTMSLTLSKKNKEIQEFYYTLSHELKTPLTSAREFVSIVNDGIAGEINQEQQQYLSYALESCDQLTNCINDLLDVTRLETGKMMINQKITVLEPLIERIISGKQKQAEQKKIKLMAKIASNIPPAYIDSHRVGQVLMNLIDNALKFTGEHGQILITVVSQTDYLRVAVSDTGCGIPTDKLPFIFDRLFQVTDDDHGKNVGLGLGLSICRELIHLHQGDIAVDSEVDEGTTFSFTLPVYVPEKHHRRSLA